MLGSRGYMGVGLQTDKGTAVAPAVYVPILPGESIVSTPELIADTRIRGIPHRVPARKGITTHGGTVSVEVDTETFGHFLCSLFGLPTTSVVETGAYKHVFKRSRLADWKSGAPLPLLTLEIGRIPGAAARRYVDTQVTAVTLRNGTDNRTLTAEFTVAALSAGDQAATVPTYNDRASLTIAGSVAKKGGSEYANLDAVEYTYDTRIEPRVMLGGVDGPSRFREMDDPTHSLSLTIEPADGSELTAYLAATTTTFGLQWDGVEIKEGVKESLKIEYAKMQWSAYPLTLRDRGKIMVPATSEIYYDPDQDVGYDVRVTLVNEIDSYE